MRFVKSLVYIAPALVAVVACDSAASELAPVETFASMGMTLSHDDINAASECRAARQHAEPSMDAAMHAAATCSVDADCTVAVTDTLCFGTLHQAVSFERLDTFMLRIAKADARFCASVPDSCGAGVDMSAAAAVCTAGLCQLAVAKVSCTAGEVATSEGCLVTSLARGKAERALAVAVDAAASCESDAECVSVTDMTGCASSCGVAINQSEAGAFTERMTEILTDYCSADVGKRERCGATTPACIQNRCELVSNH